MYTSGIKRCLYCVAIFTLRINRRTAGPINYCLSSECISEKNIVRRGIFVECMSSPLGKNVFCSCNRYDVRALGINGINSALIIRFVEGIGVQDINHLVNLLIRTNVCRRSLVCRSSPWRGLFYVCTNICNCIYVCLWGVVNSIVLDS